MCIRLPARSVWPLCSLLLRANSPGEIIGPDRARADQSRFERFLKSLPILPKGSSPSVERGLNERGLSVCEKLRPGAHYRLSRRLAVARAGNKKTIGLRGPDGQPEAPSWCLPKSRDAPHLMAAKTRYIDVALAGLLKQRET